MSAVSLAEFTLAAGYESPTAFGKTFEQHFGLSPSKFRGLTCNAATQLLLNSQAKKPVSIRTPAEKE
jgi:AraC-like DNA-binding protein